MQIITQGDYLMFISEDPTVEEKDKVQAFKWSDIQTISFRYPSKNYFRYIKNGLGILAGIFIGSDVSGISNNCITIEVDLKTGKKSSSKIMCISINHAQKLEKEFSRRLKMTSIWDEKY